MTDNSIFNFNIQSTTSNIDHSKRIKLYCSDKDNELHERLYENQLKREKFLYEHPKSCIFYKKQSNEYIHNNKIKSIPNSTINTRVTKCGIPVQPIRENTSTVEPILSRKQYITKRIQRLSKRV